MRTGIAIGLIFTAFVLGLVISTALAHGMDMMSGMGGMMQGWTPEQMMAACEQMMQEHAQSEAQAA